MLQFDLDNLDTQRIGRMGELVVELGLLSRGWMVGNFNATTMNSAGWDLFACRGTRTVKIRVKAKRPGTQTFRWSAKSDGSILGGLEFGATDDFVAAVSFEQTGDPKVYIVPSAEVELALATNHAEWVSAPKKDGSARKDGSMRHLYIDERPEAGPSHGYLQKWQPYLDRWDLLA